MGAFPEQEKLILAAFIAHSPSWKDIQDYFLGNAFPDGREEEVCKICETIAAQVRVFRGWLRSQKADDWLERARQVRAEEEKKVRLDDEEAEIRHRSRVSSLGIVMSTSESANIAANDDESKDNEESKGEDDVDNTETKEDNRHTNGTTLTKTKDDHAEEMENNFAYKAMPQTPRSFDELCMLIEDRCRLVLHFENKHDRNGQKEAGFSDVLYESKLAQSHKGVPSSLLRSSSFNESDNESDEDCNVSESQKDEDVVATSCQVITKYVQYGALAAPTLMRIMIKLRTARAQQRIEGLTYFKELLSSTSFSSMYIDCILPLREALGGLHKSHNERNKNSYVSLERPSNDITKGVENVYHYVNNIGGCPPGLLLQVHKCFQDLFKVLVGLLEDATSKGYSENSSFVQVLLDTLTLDYQPMDHKLLHSSGLIRCLHRCLSIYTVEKTAKAWYEKYDKNWQPAQQNSIISYLSDKISSVFDGAAKTERFTWNPWPPHVVRHALISGKLSIRELVCKIRETPPNLLDFHSGASIVS